MGQEINLEPDGFAAGMAYIEVEHSLFDALIVYWTPATGVCKVAGFHNIVQPDEYGDAHKHAYERFSGYVEEKYGNPSEQFDFLREGSIWEEPRDWLAGLRTNERTLASYWIASEGVSLPDTLESISVVVVEDAITVRYEFENFETALRYVKSSIVDQF